MSTIDTSQMDSFITRLLDVLRDHADTRSPTDDEVQEGTSLWRLTTPEVFLRMSVDSLGDELVPTLVQQIKHAHAMGRMDRVLFLTLCLSRLPGM